MSDDLHLKFWDVYLDDTEVLNDIKTRLAKIVDEEIGAALKDYWRNAHTMVTYRYKPPEIVIFPGGLLSDEDDCEIRLDLSKEVDGAIEELQHHPDDRKILVSWWKLFREQVTKLESAIPEEERK